MDEMSGATAMTWEELEDCGELERRLQKIPQPSKYQSQSCQSITLAARPKDASRNNTSMQPVRILKRQPNSDPCLAATEARAAAHVRPIRTLEEREAAYAEARRRILGPSPAETVACSPSGSAAVNTSNNFRKSPKPSHDMRTSSSTTALVNGYGARR